MPKAYWRRYEIESKILTDCRICRYDGDRPLSRSQCSIRASGSSPQRPQAIAWVSTTWAGRGAIAEEGRLNG